MQEGEQQLLTKSHKYWLCVEYLSITMRYLGEILFVVVLIATSYANLQKGALRVQFQPPPVPLLKNNTTVTSDFYGGDISTPFAAVLNSDVSLVMYYAPWDLDSQLAIHDFEKIAAKYEGQVFFSSINCWVHNGACKKTFPKLRNFPLILGYVGGTKGVQYRGPLQYEFMDKFVQNLLKPIKRIETVVDLYKLMTQATAVVTGYFDFSMVKPNGFYSFYLASLRNLEYDAHKSIVFATITNPTAASRLGINLSNSYSHNQLFDVRLHLWNETLIYPITDKTIDVSRLLQWVHYRSHSPVQWIWPSGRKNQVIQHYFIDQQRPSLILFTPTSKYNFQAMLMKELALDYNNCAFSPRIARLIQEIQRQRYIMETSRLEFEKKCSIFQMERQCCNNNTAICTDPIATDTNVSGGINGEKICTLAQTKMPQFQGLSCRTNRSLNFFIMDSEHYPDFLTKLGYSTRKNRQNPNVAFIIDPKAESHFVMDQPMTKLNLQQMIVNYTENNLRRFRRSQVTSKQCSPGRVCIQEVSAENFESVVLDQSYDTIVFYRKSGCVFCEVGARAFLKLSQMFSKSDNFPSDIEDNHEIRFVTIDAEKNDLPWQYTVDKYPSIIFYPAHRKFDSRIYPYNLELNEVNLLNFTVTQLSLKNRITWFINSCQDAACLQEAQRQIGTQIVNIDQQIRSLRHRYLWSDIQEQSSVLQLLQDWLKERYFFRELGYSVRRVVVELLRRKGNERYPDGVRLTAYE